MAKCGTTRKALHKQVASILSGVWITKQDSIQQQPSALESIEDDYIAPRPYSVVQQTRLQPAPAYHDRTRQKRIGCTQPAFACILKGLKRFVRHILPARSKSEEKRLGSDWDNWRC